MGTRVAKGVQNQLGVYTLRMERRDPTSLQTVRHVSTARGRRLNLGKRRGVSTTIKVEGCGPNTGEEDTVVVLHHGLVLSPEDPSPFPNPLVLVDQSWVVTQFPFSTQSTPIVPISVFCLMVLLLNSSP